MTITLRHFKDEDDLFDNVENSLILNWVNELHRLKSQQKAQGNRYRIKGQILAKLAMERLDADELARVRAEVFERVEDES